MAPETTVQESVAMAPLVSARRVSPVAFVGALEYVRQRFPASCCVQNPAAAVLVVLPAGTPTIPGSEPGALGRHWPSGPICGQVGAGMDSRFTQVPSGARAQAPGGRLTTRLVTGAAPSGVAVTSTVAGADHGGPALARRRA